MINNSYKYSIEMILCIDNENININSESISNIIIDSNYDIYNRPIIYLFFNVQSRIFNKIALNNNGIINLRIRKTNSYTVSISKDYIHDKFIYIMNTNPDYYRDIKDKVRLDGALEEEEHVKQCCLLLFKKDSIDNIKKLYCNILKNCNMASIIHHYTNDKQMIISPLKSTKIIDSIIIPPMESLSELLSYLNNYDAFYNNSYRYFEDFNSYYLLDNDIRSTHGLDKYDTININILDILDDRANQTGLIIDNDSKCYILYVNANSTSMDIDLISYLEYNSIIGITYDGEVIKDNLFTHNNIYNKPMIKIINNDNYRMFQNIKNDLKSSSIFLQLTKSEIDSSIFTPNKEYLIKNYKYLSEYNGKYILSYKKEIIVQEGTSFVSKTVLGFRKAIKE